MLLNDHSKKIVLDLEALAKIAEGLKQAGHKIVVTIGSWDMLHIGHCRYLKKAKSTGDILIAGVDSDRAIKIYKGPMRPMIPEKERLEMLSYQEFVDFVTVVDDVDDKGAWQYALIKAVQPDVFIAVVDSYSKKQLEELRQYCKEVIVLERQAETSTSNQLRKMMREFMDPMVKFLREHDIITKESV
ncbi:adenylyltransferase/cytidyltransferase family protein [Candidatus Wolfebacteria bacterium]|nr:adenylyltransferase/cytidyltransferase family protein [Candidatus Wolfebacteria bacterium]